MFLSEAQVKEAATGYYPRISKQAAHQIMLVLHYRVGDPCYRCFPGISFRCFPGIFSMFYVQTSEVIMKTGENSTSFLH